MVTEARRVRLQAVAEQRTTFVTLALDGVFDGHNVAAILRSADAFGVQDVHAVENGREAMRINRKVARGTDGWVDLYRWPDRSAMLQALRAQGFAVWVAAADDGTVDIADWQAEQPTVFLFGNEHRGVSAELREAADVCFALPMVGMVESLNVSVATALTLAHARRTLESSGAAFRLSPPAQAALVARWTGSEEGLPA